jgi:hypothetical protein
MVNAWVENANCKLKYKGSPNGAGTTNALIVSFTKL